MVVFVFFLLRDVKHNIKNISLPGCYQEKESIFTHAVVKVSSGKATKSPEKQVLDLKDNLLRQGETLVSCFNNSQFDAYTGSRFSECFVGITTYLPLSLSRGVLQASPSSSSAVSILTLLPRTSKPQDHFQQLLHRYWHEPAACGQHGKIGVLVRTSWWEASIRERASMSVGQSGRCQHHLQSAWLLLIGQKDLWIQGKTPAKLITTNRCWHCFEGLSPCCSAKVYLSKLR